MDRNDPQISSQDLEAIKNFELDEDCLRKLDDWTKEMNFFEITGIDMQEIRHSNFLAWLFSAREPHGLGDRVIKSYLKQVIHNRDLLYIHKVLDLDFQSFEVRREWNNLDICLVSDKEHFVIVIENKIGAKEGHNQTLKYRAIVDNIYKNYERLYIFLTPEGVNAKDDAWLSSTYSDIVTAIRENLDYARDSVRPLLRQYINVLEKRVITSDRLRQICKEIYQKHKAAIDLIYNYVGSYRAQVREWIVEFLKQNADSYQLVFRDDWCSSFCIRFTSRRLYEKFGHSTTNWSQPIDCDLVYEIYIPEDLSKIRSWLIISNPERPLNQQAVEIGANHREKSHITKQSTGRLHAHIFNTPKPLLTNSELKQENARAILEQNLRKALDEAQNFEKFLLSELTFAESVKV